ncbi:phosphatidate cytidylyltransferase [Polycladomyces sp. WAk]|uniref:Phosphatidate cytidylyltransferase n=1 Tax=Polycladomyces zharkentensis TaxID=2807616 RepID=A0ABS2WIY2_9BACL|nr:phosphatidate cytidylyltransferase [Polycladomyces sp. WAk]MBN2909359.1 phosphatidate cytidylyltransferase [Polycladomyces sp. WAk]
MKQRVITGVLGAAGFLFLLWMGGWWYTGLVGLLATVGYAEYCRMNRVKWNSLQAAVGFLLVWLLFLSGLVSVVPLPFTGVFHSPENILIGLILFFLLTVWTKNRVNIHETAYLLVGALYIGYGFSFMMQLIWRHDGWAWTLLILLITWTNDSGAYFVGKRFGRRSLWPAISPNKTVEGSIGGIMFSVLMGVVAGWILPIETEPLALLGISLLVAVTGQLGDLVESAWKRTTGVKDSGMLLPGHGGVLDRFDSLLFSLIVLKVCQLI